MNKELKFDKYGKVVFKNFRSLYRFLKSSESETNLQAYLYVGSKRRKPKQ